MPARLSKFAIEATCRRYAHPWSDSCVSTTAGLGLQALQESLRIYSTLYFITLLTKGRIPTIIDMKRTISSIIQSTAFLSWSAFAYSMFICLFRRLLGHFNILTVSFLPSFFSSLSAIVIERPSRRTMLCLYVSNIATETLFKMAVSRGYVPCIPKGEVYIFAAGMATLLYLFRSKSNNGDSIFKVIRVGLGPCEEKGYKKVEEEGQEEVIKRNERGECEMMEENSRALTAGSTWTKALGKALRKALRKALKLYELGIGGLRSFASGLSIQALLKLIFQMKGLLQRRKKLADVCFTKDNLKLGCFLGGFSASYRLVSCLLRRAYKRDSAKYAIVAGLIASSSFSLYPDNAIALYVAWKALQLLWESGVESGRVPQVKWFVVLLYCLSTATLFHAAIVEPQNLRPTYWKFLYNISGGRIASMSRLPIDEFGLGSDQHLRQVLEGTRTHDKHVYSF